LQALALVASRAPGLSIVELAEALGVHRTIAYRLIATLEVHGLVVRAPKGLIRLGAGIVALASRFEPQLREVAQPILDRLANETGAAAFISVPQGSECVAIMVAEPQTTLLRVAYRIGNRHPLTRGAAGIAILAGRPEGPTDPEEVRTARHAGYSVTRGQLQAGAVGVACPLYPLAQPGHVEASVGVVTLGEAGIEALTEAVQGAVHELRAILNGAERLRRSDRM
jgi:DNA-binding IclR family transcriptional regulator